MGDTPGLIDTDILIDAARGFDAATRFISAQSESGVRISVVSAMELVVGCRDKNELRKVQEFLDAITVVPVTAEVSSTARTLVESYWLSHGMLLPDAFIAATAQFGDLALYTRNVRHFQFIPDLRVVRPY